MNRTIRGAATTRRTRPATIALAILAALAALVAALATIAPAAAHDYLIDVSPAEGEVLAEAPSEANMLFSGDILHIGTELALVRADTLELVEFPAPYALSNGRVIQPLPPLDPGPYTLNWRVVSEDGHPIAGSIGFAVADADGVVPTSEARPETAATATGEQPEAGGMPPAATIAIVAVAALAAAGAGALMVMRMKRGAPGPRWDDDSDEPEHPGDGTH